MGFKPVFPLRDEWGNGAYFELKTPGSFVTAMSSLIEDAHRSAMPPGSRFELRLAADRGPGTLPGMCWYRAGYMDDAETWGTEPPGQRNGYILIGQYVKPEDKKTTSAFIPGCSPQPNHFDCHDEGSGP